MNKYLAEFIGTFWLVFGGCGSAIFAAAFPELRIGFLGVALAFGLTVLTGAFALRHISGEDKFFLSPLITKPTICRVCYCSTWNIDRLML